MEIQFFIAGRQGQVDDQHPLWTVALPMRRSPAGTDPDGTVVTHGAYFEAIQTYLQSEGGQHLCSALNERSPEALSLPALERIDVILEKHGEFYHPARIVTPSLKPSSPFVLNVAVTPTGIQWMVNETESLRKVAGRLPERTLPHVYGIGNVTNANNQNFRMFLADWFEDCDEFHLSIDPLDGEQKIIVWDNRKAPYFLPPEHVNDVYYQAAFLLSRAYDPQTTRQIYPWHHASGDFVIRHAKDGVALKLITVRQYGPTLATEDGHLPDDESRQMAAVVFFANLSIRNRIDRFDGTGELAWAGDEVVGPTVAGFKQGLDDTLVDSIGGMLTGFSDDDWLDLLTAVGAQYCLMPAEKDLLARYTASHAMVLREAVRKTFC